jgi:hypothetical protein
MQERYGLAARERFAGLLAVGPLALVDRHRRDDANRLLVPADPVPSSSHVLKPATNVASGLPSGRVARSCGESRVGPARVQAHPAPAALRGEQPLGILFERLAVCGAALVATRWVSMRLGRDPRELRQSPDASPRR